MDNRINLRWTLALSSLMALGVNGCAHQVDEFSEKTEDLPTGDEKQSLEQPKTVSLNGCSGQALPLYRYWNASSPDHFYTTNWDELGYGKSGWRIEGVAAWLPAARFSSCGAVALHRYWGNGDHFYTTSWSELGYGKSGYAYEGVAGYCFPSPVTDTVPLYRYWGNGDHFYTTNWGELGAGKSGYAYEGIQCYVIP